MSFWKIRMIKMGQYYMIANLDKKEFLYPHKMGSGLKLWEIAASDLPRVLVLLLQDSDGRGGGDGDIDNPVISKFCGRWAGDRLAIVGDYDSKNIYGQMHDEEQEHYDPEWVDIFYPVRFAYEKWIDYEDYRLGRTWGHEEEWNAYLKTRGEGVDLKSPKEGAGSLRPDMILRLG